MNADRRSGLTDPLFLFSVLDESEWLTLCSGRFTTCKRHLQPLNTRLGRPHCRSGRFLEETFLASSGILTPDLPKPSVFAVSPTLLQPQILAAGHLSEITTAYVPKF